MRHRRLSLILLLLATWGASLGQAKAQTAARVWNEQMLAAIRRNVPNPPAHARNLFHTAVAMYDAWAAYDPTAVGYLYNEKVSPLPGDVEAARHEAVSYAAYRVLRARFATGAGSATSLASFDTQLGNLGYSSVIGQGALTAGTTPAEVGKRIGQMVLNWGASDGFTNVNYPQAYTSAVNPNLSVPLSVLGTNTAFQSNMPLGFGIPDGTNPNLWQPLDLSTSISQNGIPTAGGPQTFVGVQSLATVPFSLTRNDATKPWIDPFGGPSKLSRPGLPSATDAAYKDTFMDVVRKTAQINDTATLDISPGATGNNPLGADTGTGYPTNPVTGLTYPANNVIRGDFVRVLAEFWADGPNSETPPGHWHVLANEVADNPALQKRIGGIGPIVNDLEWDVKTYLSLSGAVHDASCAAWALKRYYSGTRPITAIRYMATKGQSSNPNLPSYSTEGIPLETDVVELITDATTAPGGKHEQIWDVSTNSYLPGSFFVDQIAIKGWPGEDPNNLPAPGIATHQSVVRWMLGKDWLPFQRKTFNTPAFPGYVSGHSSFSRSSAEVLKLITGSPYFPGGFHHHTVNANSMQIDLGPSAAVDLQWASYYDAADQAGQSRRWGGIHPYEDDYHGRVIGSQVGISAYTKAAKYWSGSIQGETIIPTVTLQADGSAVITWPATVDMYYKVQKSTNFTAWTDVSDKLYAHNASGTYTDTSYTPGTLYQLIQTTPTIARQWNEQILSAIRIDKPNPPVHARNLFHLATVMYDCWAAYDTTAVGYIHHERATAGDVLAARNEAISYAAYRLLKSRYAGSASAATTLAALDAKMAALGYDINVTTTAGTSPAAVGNRIAATILAWGLADGSNQANGYADPTYTDTQPAMIVLQTGLAQGFGVPDGTTPNRWQPLAFDAAFTQNGLQADLVQKYVGVSWLNALPFSHERLDPAKPWIDPGPPSQLGTPTDASYKAQMLAVARNSSKLNSTEIIDISPGVFGNNPLGSDSGTGHPINPITGQPYASNPVKLGDFARVIAEFWADGPSSETPPGHWHVLGNNVSDDSRLVKKIGGTGPVVDDLEWDVKMYLSISAATHDAGCACWSVKRYYLGPRPVTAIRYMASKGQSSNPALPSYSPQGLPLEDGVTELITEATTAPGGKHEQIWDMNSNQYQPGSFYIGTVAIYSWPGEPANPATQTNPVRWMKAVDWVPYQRKTFNTPAFPGYISGHSCFSRSAAYIMDHFTGSPYFPGGLGSFTAPATTFLVFERGPSQTVNLQWSTYYDAADQAGQSRRWGGIHPSEDDYSGRIVGAETGKLVWNLVQKYFNGGIVTEKVIPAQTFLPGGGVKITAHARRGLYYHLESSTNLSTWTTVGTEARATDTQISITDPATSSTPKFYRIVWDAKAP